MICFFAIIITPEALKIVSNSLFWANFVKKNPGHDPRPEIEPAAYRMRAAKRPCCQYYFSQTSRDVRLFFFPRQTRIAATAANTRTAVTELSTPNSTL